MLSCRRARSASQPHAARRPPCEAGVRASPPRCLSSRDRVLRGGARAARAWRPPTREAAARRPHAGRCERCRARWRPHAHLDTPFGNSGRICGTSAGRSSCPSARARTASAPTPGGHEITEARSHKNTKAGRHSYDFFGQRLVSAALGGQSFFVAVAAEARVLTHLSLEIAAGTRSSLGNAAIVTVARLDTRHHEREIGRISSASTRATTSSRSAASSARRRYRTAASPPRNRPPP